MSDEKTLPGNADVVTRDEPDPDSFNDQQDDYRQNSDVMTTAMQQFAEHWANNRNQIKAYQHAYPGCTHNTARTHARRLFADGRVQAEIRRIIERGSDFTKTTIEQCKHELTRIAKSDIRKVFDGKGNMLDPHQWDADTAAAVSSVKEVRAIKGRGADQYVEVTRTVRLWDKQAANRTLLETAGAFDKKKAPPGIQAHFSFNFGAGPQPMGGVTIDQTQKPSKPAKTLKKQGKPAKPGLQKRPGSIKTGSAIPEQGPKQPQNGAKPDIF